MISNFEKSLALVLAAEGGFVDHPAPRKEGMYTNALEHHIRYLLLGAARRSHQD